MISRDGAAAFVYAVAMVVPGQPSPPIKIGTATNIDTRLQVLRTGSPYLLIILDYWGFDSKAEAHSAERRAHVRFNRNRLHGEWFEAPYPEVAQYMDFISDWWERQC